MHFFKSEKYSSQKQIGTYCKISVSVAQVAVLWNWEIQGKASAPEQHVLLSSTFVHCHPCSSKFVHIHPLSSTFVLIHPLLSTFDHIHPLSSTIVHNHPLSSTFIHFRPHSSTVIHVHTLSTTFIHFHALPSILIHFHSGGLPWFFSDHHRMVLNARNLDGWIGLDWMRCL